MLLSQSIIRRYTPPTCTLEVLAKSSPLSRWAGRPLLKELGFELRFDDPRLPEEEQVTIRGDRIQLELLYDAVTSYVQDFLQQPPTILPLTFGTSVAPSPSTPDEAETSSPDGSSVLEPSEEADDEEKTNPLVALPSTPSLKPRGLLAHELFFGSLATEASGPVIKLSALQLFDLATALEEYSAEVAPLPALNRSTGRKATIVWASTAAAVLLAMGLTTVGVRVFNQSNTEAESIASVQQKESQPTQPTPIAVLPPVPPAPTSTPVPSPTLPPPLSSVERLPPPLPVTPPKPLTRNGSVPLTIPPETSSLPPAASSTPFPQRQTIAVDPKSQGKTSSPSLPPVPAPSTSSAAPRNIQPSSPSSSRTTTINPNLPNLPPLQPKSSAPEQALEDTSAATDTDSTDSNLLSESRKAAGDVAPNTLPESIPQVAQVRKYFQQRWQPPEGLSRTLEYRLVLNRDGSIARIVPLGQASKIYLDRTGMPLMGESFVSPLEGEGNPKIRLVLSPDGTVKTFLEPG
ncbi:MAG: DUF4335 domain-containing protein [Xenococcaceae cyanobacterium]